MKMIKVVILACITAAVTLCACRVETKTESVPEAEGSGKKAINIRVEPLTRDEIKTVTDKTIDRAAEASSAIREAATSAVSNAQQMGKAATTFSDTMATLRHSGDDTTAVTTVTKVSTENQ